MATAMKSRVRGLTMTQRRAAILLAGGATVSEAAEKVGCVATTVSLWQREEEFQREIERIQEPVVADAQAALARLVDRAERTADALMSGRAPTPGDGELSDVPPSVQATVAMGVLRLAVPARQEISGPDGGPIGLQGVPMADMTDDELEAWAVSRGLRTAISGSEE